MMFFPPQWLEELEGVFLSVINPLNDTVQVQCIRLCACTHLATKPGSLDLMSHLNKIIFMGTRLLHHACKIDFFQTTVNNKHLMTGPEGNSEFCFPRI